MNSGASYLCKTKVQLLMREFEVLSINNDELVLDYVKKLSRIVTKMRRL